ncbi:hypothetical protein TNCV_231321 [Trichonephila clavipes]|nr:hypothetical protein TNCV_231321 [Trichonephila clavipes]
MVPLKKQAWRRKKEAWESASSFDRNSKVAIATLQKFSVSSWPLGSDYASLWLGVLKFKVRSYPRYSSIQLFVPVRSSQGGYHSTRDKETTSKIRVYCCYLGYRDYGNIKEIVEDIKIMATSGSSFTPTSLGHEQNVEPSDSNMDFARIAHVWLRPNLLCKIFSVINMDEFLDGLRLLNAAAVFISFEGPDTKLVCAESSPNFGSNP